MSNSFTTAPNTRLLIVSIGVAAGFDVHFIHQTGGQQTATFVANAATRDEAVARARAYAEMTGQCWILALEGRQTEWIPPIYPRLEHRAHAQYAV